MIRIAHLTLAMLVLGVFGPADCFAKPRVDVVVGAEAPPLERETAAGLISEQFTRLFDADVHIGTTLPDGAEFLIVVGSPRTNPAISKLLADWPKLSDQGHILKSVTHQKRAALIVGGGSPAATFWSAAELGHRHGIRYLLFGDLDPVTKPALHLDGYDVLLEPAFRVRGWAIPTGTNGPFLGTKDHENLLLQLAKLKFNFAQLSVDPFAPAVDFEWDSGRRTSATAAPPEAPAIAGDTAGRGAFHGSRQLHNPDFGIGRSPEDLVKAAGERIQKLSARAHQLGMQFSLKLHPLYLGDEYVPLLEQAGQAGSRKLRLGLAEAQLKAYVSRFPDVDEFCLDPFSTHTDPGLAERSSAELTQRLKLPADVSLPALLEQASKSGPLAESLTRAAIVELDLLSDLIARDEIWSQGRKSPARVALTNEDGLLPVLAAMSGMQRPVEVFVLDSATTRAAKLPDGLLQQARGVPLRAVLEGGDDWHGLLPKQLVTKQTPEKLRLLQAQGVQEWIAHEVHLGDVDLSLEYLSRSAFEPDVVPADVWRASLDSICGPGVADSVLKALELNESAMEIIGKETGVGFHRLSLYGTPQTEPPAAAVPAWHAQAQEHFLNAMNEMYRANTRAREGGRAFTLYFARRFEFAYSYFDCLANQAQVIAALQKDDKAAAIAALEKEGDNSFAAAEAMAAVARSPSDQEIILRVNEQFYWPARKKLDDLEMSE